jgi:hypothetical protein
MFGMFGYLSMLDGYCNDIMKQRGSSGGTGGLIRLCIAAYADADAEVLVQIPK